MQIGPHTPTHAVYAPVMDEWGSGGDASENTI